MFKIIDSFSGDYRWLSNFYYSPCTVAWVEWPTVEHGYQFFKQENAEKRAENIEELEINTFKSGKKKYLYARPWEVKAWGQEVAIRPDWEAIKDSVMTRFIKAKFADPDLHEKLLATGDAELIEGNTWNDTYWGVCNGVGKNMLGKILMAERAELRMFI